MAGKQGFASMDDSTKKRIQSEGGKASHSGSGASTKAGTTNKSGGTGSNLTDAAKSKGGRNNHR